MPVQIAIEFLTAEIATWVIIVTVLIFTDKIENMTSGNRCKRRFKKERKKEKKKEKRRKKEEERTNKRMIH